MRQRLRETLSSVRIAASQPRQGALHGSTLAALALLPIVIGIGNPLLSFLAGALVAIAAQRRPFGASNRFASYMLQTAIVLLGLKLDLSMVWSLSAQYTSAVAAYVTTTLVLGLAVGRCLNVPAPGSKLISAGTAICGATAIATLSGLVRAQPHHTGVALAVVFVLNAVAMLAFPWIGSELEMSSVQFGLWCALAIHDTSSVIGTATMYSERAAEVATIVKLGRTLWLIPVTLAIGLLERSSSDAHGSSRPRLRVPIFIVLFLVAASVGSTIDLPVAVDAAAGSLSRWLLVAALFMAGLQIDRAMLRQIGGRMVWQAVGLWMLIAPATLGAVVWLA